MELSDWRPSTNPAPSSASIFSATRSRNSGRINHLGGGGGTLLLFFRVIWLVRKTLLDVCERHLIRKIFFAKKKNFRKKIFSENFFFFLGDDESDANSNSVCVVKHFSEISWLVLIQWVLHHSPWGAGKWLAVRERRSSAGRRPIFGHFSSSNLQWRHRYRSPQCKCDEFRRFYFYRGTPGRDCPCLEDATAKKNHKHIIINQSIDRPHDMVDLPRFLNLATPRTQSTRRALVKAVYV